MKALTKTDFNFPGQKSVYKGKVRDVYDINDEYLKQLDKIIRHAKDAFASVTVNYFGWKLYYGKQQDCFTGAERCK